MLIVPNDVLLRNALAPIDSKLPPSATAGILEQFTNTELLIVWIFPAIVSVLVILLQLMNAELSIEVTLGGMFNVPNVVQPKNASTPIVRKLPPSATAGIFEQFWNALCPIVVIFPAIVSVLVIPVQLANANTSILLTLGGIFNVLSVVQPLNADCPIDNKLPPSATAGIFKQLENAWNPMV
jgi:hypothetical protein